ncbi:MAG TPA: hypothetical protein ENK85_10110, partial [Saprospiraceae bacterium]|nr:hypothetical protein [Saprospiraceae bacterium]
MKQIASITSMVLLLLVPIFISAQNPSTVGELIGVNIRAKDGYPQGFKKFGLVREYHEWASDVGYDNDDQTNCDFLSDPNFRLKLNPSTDPSTLLNFDGFYKAFSGKVSPCLKGVAPPMRGLESYCDIVLEQKPVCLGDGQPGYGTSCDNESASQLAVMDENEFPLTLNSWEAPLPNDDGYYDGIGMTEIADNTTYEGHFTIQRNDLDATANTFFFVKIWLDRKSSEWVDGDYPDGQFNNRAYQRDSDGHLVLSGGLPLANPKYEAIKIIGENNATEHLLILKKIDFINGKKEVEYEFSTGTLPVNGLYRLRIAVNTMTIDGNEFTQPYDLNGNPILSPNKMNLHTYSWPQDGIPGKAYWKPSTPISASGDIWDVGLLKCGTGQANYPSSGIWAAGDYATQIVQFSLKEINAATDQLILNEPFQVNNTQPYVFNGYNNFVDFKKLVSGNEYNLKIKGLAGQNFKMWIKSNSNNASELTSGVLNGSNGDVTFTLPASTSPGIYRLRIGIGDNPAFDGNFDGELRDYLLSITDGTGIVPCEVPVLDLPTANTTTNTPVFESVQLVRVINQDDPEKYRDFAEWSTIMAAKYGQSTISSDAEMYFKDRINESDPSFSQGDIKYIEIGNEQDKFWRGDQSLLGTGLNMYQMIPSQYAAFLSAAYDGGCQSMGDYIGVKNFADIKVVNGGLAGFQGKTLEETIDYCVNNLQRNQSTDCHNHYLPFDVINFHQYCTTTNAIPANSESDPFNNTNPLPPSPTNLPAEYLFAYYYETPTDIGLNGGIGASPEEGGLKTYIKLTLERLMTHIASNPGLLKEFAEKEVWLSEFGYDSELGSPVSVKQISGQSLQRTQADWLIRSYLEISAAKAIHGNYSMKINRAMAFDYRDTKNASPLYQRSGLLNADYAPKKSWFHVQTLRNVLGGMTYQGEFTGKTMSGGNFDFSEDARIYHYQGDYKGNQADILVIWSPNSSDSEGELNLDFHNQEFLDRLLEQNTNSAIDTITIITPRDGDEDGYHKAIKISNNTYTFTGDHA